MTVIDRPPIAQTPLHPWHVTHGGRLVDFAGWEMPVQYGSIVEEHQATRTAAGLFDVSHMGRLLFRGPDAAKLLDHLVTRQVSLLRTGQVRYGLVCNEAGGVLDDVLVARVGGSGGADDYALVVNASNRKKLLAWIGGHVSSYDVEVIDQTESTAMIALQGPEALAMLAPLTETPLESMRYYTTQTTILADTPCSVSRTGYTGEDGFELVCEASAAIGLWEQLIDAGAKPCGLAARDTLRLEAGMPLYGHELTEDLNPLQAGLAFAVSFETPDGSAREFLGHDALSALRDDTTQPQRVGLLVEGRRPPREGYRVLHAGTDIGFLSSGTHSPTLGRPIAMAYVEPAFVACGTELSIDVRGTLTPAVVAPLPFYKKE